MDKSLARAAVVLASAPLALGFATTGPAVADSHTAPLAPDLSARASAGADFVSGSERASQREVDRLRKSLERARRVRADARGSLTQATVLDNDAGLAATASQATVVSSTTTEERAKAGLAEARTRLDDVVAAIKNGSDLLAANAAAQGDAERALLSAEGGRDAAVATAADLKDAMGSLVASRDAAARQVTEAESQVAWIESFSLPQAQSYLEFALSNNDRVRQAWRDANTAFSSLIASRSCRVSNAGMWECYDAGTGAYATDPYVNQQFQVLINQQPTLSQADSQVYNAQNALASVQASLTSWTNRRTDRRTVLLAAQGDVDTAVADLNVAEAALAAAKDAIAAQHAALDDLVVKADDLEAGIEVAKAEKLSAAAAEASSAASLATATSAVAAAKNVHAADLRSQARAERAKSDAAGRLDDAQHKARDIKVRLVKAWKAARDTRR